MILERRVLYPLAIAVLVVYFAFFTWKGALLYFDQDDLMNAYVAWAKTPAQILLANARFWSTFFRPLGAAFYRVMYGTVGFHPWPFHVVCLAIAVFNGLLCFWFARLVSASERVAALAVALFAFHSRLMEIWYRISVVYDLLCFAFFFLALCLYIDGRRQGSALGWKRGAAVMFCYLCALNSKEMAVSFPVVILVWEILYGAKFRQWWPTVATGLMTAVYIYGKQYGPAAITSNAAYLPVYSPERFEANWTSFLNHLFLLDDGLEDWACFVILGAALAIAVVMRSRALLLAWTLIFATVLPVVFLPGRGAFVLYMPYAAIVLFPAVLLVRLQDRVTRKHVGVRPFLAAFVFLAVLGCFGAVNWIDQDPHIRRPWLYDSPKMVRNMADQLLAMHPKLPAGASVLLVNDPFDDDWTAIFLVRLFYGDRTMLVDRPANTHRAPGDWQGYEFVFAYANGTYRQLKP